MPQYNFERKNKIGSPFGFLATILITFMALAYTKQKFIDLVTFKNPVVVKSTEINKHQNRTTSLDLDSEALNFHVAFMVRDAATGKVKHDENHVEWYGAIFENDGTVETLKQKIGVH